MNAKATALSRDLIKVAAPGEPDDAPAESAAPVVEALPEARIGRLVSISGAQAVALLEDFQGEEAAEALAKLQMGSLVRIPAPSSIVFGMISGLSIPIPARDSSEREMKIIELELVGECLFLADGSLSKVRRGLSAFPPLGADIFAASPEDLRYVYVRDGVSVGRVGAIHQDRRLPAQISVDDLLGKHFAVVGATGAGKSCAVTLILRAILERHPNGHIMLLDPHNEYPRAFGDRANVIDVRSLQLPYWMFNLEEIREVLANTGARIGTTESALLNEFITAAKRQFLGPAAEGHYITADTPSPYRMNQVVDYIIEIMGRLDKPDDLAPYEELKAAIGALQHDVRFGFMFERGIATRDSMATVISRLFRVPVAGKPLTILDLSAVPSEILNVVVSVLCRTAFEFGMWSEGRVPVLLVCEEAHLYAPENVGAGFEPTKRALSRIAKEGRKYGLSLCVASQRPAELSASMLSQCSTIFAMRLTHQKDQDWVRAALSDGALGLLEALPSLANAEAIAVGEGISLPMRLVFDLLPPDQRPRSATAVFSSAWQNEVTDGEAFLQEVIGRWRRQRH
jgi:uncharacterized protein